MTGRGLAEVANPSALFLSARDRAAPGAAVFAGMEGSRPLLVEFQALVAPSSLGTPRRAVVGWDASRLAMIVAVLETHAGLKLGQHDIYLTVAGGLRVGEPAADLAAAAALVSSLSNIALAADSVFFGEIALSGAIRPVAHALARLKEAAKLGFRRATIPGPGRARWRRPRRISPRRCGHISGLAADIGARPRRAARRTGRQGDSAISRAGLAYRLIAAP